MSGLKDIPFPMVAAISEPIRHEQMRICLQHGFPQMAQAPMTDDTLTLACYGPSLADTWHRMKHPIMAMSGAVNYLLERGIVPDYFCQMDPRQDALPHILKPHPDIQYLMATVCHPFTWPLLKKNKLKVWHVVSGKQTRRWIAANDPGSLLVSGGSSIGLASIHLGGLLGFRRFEIHGMDGCWKGDVRHAGKHFGNKQTKIDWTVNGNTYKTSKIMVNSAVELINMLKTFPFLAVLHGEGLQQDMVIEANLPNGAVAGTEKAELVRTAEIKFRMVPKVV